MTHYFFRPDGGEADADVVERDLPDLEQARIEARYDARDMLVEGVLHGEDRLDWRMVVTDEAGRTVLHLPFAAAFRTH